jgi:predicted nucleotidyltransferase
MSGGGRSSRTRKRRLGRDPILAEARRRLVNDFQPLRIILFGSRAWGRPRRESDYDLMVIVRDPDDERALAGRMRVALWGLPAAFDIVVRDRSWWEEWADTPCSLEDRIAHEGVLIHDADRETPAARTSLA